jgi:hypothetical protein
MASFWLISAQEINAHVQPVREIGQIHCSHDARAHALETKS